MLARIPAVGQILERLVTKLLLLLLAPLVDLIKGVDVIRLDSGL